MGKYEINADRSVWRDRKTAEVNHFQEEENIGSQSLWERKNAVEVKQFGELAVKIKSIKQFAFLLPFSLF